MSFVRPGTTEQPKEMTMDHPAEHIDIPLTRAEYYPPESEVGEDDIGILDTDVSVIDVDHHVHDTGIVTLGAHGIREDEVLIYEFDMTSAGARHLSALLAEAADGADLP